MATSRLLGTLTATLFLCSLSLALHAQAITGEVVAILDGDTIDVLDPDNLTDGPVRVRLHGIDAPEKAQPFGQRARQYLSELCFRVTVDVQVTDTDRYGRTIGRVYVDGEDVNLRMVEVGLAWWYAQYAPTDDELASAHEEARLLGLGLWADRNPIAPWDWRRGQRTPTDLEPEAEEEVLPSFDPTPQPRPAQPAKTCCRVCKKGKPCGNSCIARNKTCRKPPGCAC